MCLVSGALVHIPQVHSQKDHDVPLFYSKIWSLVFIFFNPIILWIASQGLGLLIFFVLYWFIGFLANIIAYPNPQ
jgi:hypothetical protein